MSEILKHKRSSLKGKLTRLRNYFDAVDINNLNNNIIFELEQRLSKIEPIFEEFNDVQTQIEVASCEVGSESKPDDVERVSFEDVYFKLIADISVLCREFNKNVNSSSDSSNGSVVGSNAGAVNSVGLQQSSLVKLPPIKLPTFDGHYDSWLEFKDAFTALVDGDQNLNDIQKFYYLRSSLEKDVLEIIKSIEVSASNYKVAWQFLKERFENKKLIIYNHIRAIFEHPNILKESYLDLRNLYDSITKHLRALKSLGEDTDSWDRLIIYIMCNKFDQVTRRDWETFKYAADLPTMVDLNNFLKFKCEILEKLEVSRNDGSFDNYRKPFNKYNKKCSNTLSVTDSDNKYGCYYCHQSHGIYKCGSFLKLSIDDRIATIKRLKLCLNCLKGSHPSWKCQRPKCFKCKKAHNSLLHSDSYNNNSKNNIENAIKGNQESLNLSKPQASGTEGRVDIIPSTSLSSHSSECAVAGLSCSHRVSQVLLSTAIISVTSGNDDRSVTVRALLDSGSQSNFISDRVCKMLNLKQIKIKHAVKGVGQILTNINYEVNVTINSHFSTFKANINCLVLPNITDKMPIISFDKNILNLPSNLILADPNFNLTKDIDVLLGSNIFWSIIGSNQIRLGPNLPILQETELGYIIAGNLGFNTSVNNISSVSCLSISDSINKNILKFWEIEEINNKDLNMSEKEKYCDNYFEETTKRDDNGRFIVNIPFKNNVHKLGRSREMALNRFNALEKRLNKNQGQKNEYIEFMQEYERLGHMSEINDTEGGFYLPHHAVIKSSSITTKCRIVFDASAKSTSGLSLNDVQYVGPTLQQDIFCILTRFRTYQYAMSGDISKMYRQILIAESERHYQKIFWRSQPNEDLKVYKLNTVTYGTASAPFLAVRCLFQAAFDNEKKYPTASRIIKRDFYMDDLLTGANSVEELLKIQTDVVKILASYGFELRKFLCNNQYALNKFYVNKNIDLGILTIGENEANKTLGVYWDANNDFINYSINLDLDFSENKATKRAILSLICQIFDPLGLLGPIIIVAKLIIQELWDLKLDWDSEIPTNLLHTWTMFYKDLCQITQLKIPRCVIFSKYINIEMHGFCDASIKAYGACIYVRCLTASGNFVSNLLCAKSRVAPLKQLSLPRLELCGAVLLSNLVKKATDCLEINFNKKYYWCDSTIALSWIKNESSKWKTFVANRVSEIRSLTEAKNWNHIQSNENPADLLSRGTTMKVLNTSKLWWYGPDWFSINNSNWNVTKTEFENLENIPEQRGISCVTLKCKGELTYILNKFSSLKKILRVLAYILRFLYNIKLNLNDRNFAALQPEEINRSLYILIKNVQLECFAQEYNNLCQNKEISKTSKILALNPFLHDGILRVGGRIKNSLQSFEKKHPIILPSSHILTRLILKEEHERLLHCGVQQLLYSVRERYWPISGRNACKNIIRRCVRCFRVSPKDLNYLMGDLPEARVSSHCIFLNVGTDFGGPFFLKDRLTRGAKLVKAYICLFVCMSTKAIHIELVSGLTTEAFMAALYRFTSRRGKPSNIYSDNGSNYKGANNELLKIYEFLKINSDFISNKLVCDQIKWHFIPARSPSFGGIWEAGIKSAKHHIKRVVGETRLTFEEFSTVLTRIEGILNSRPLCPITEDPEDISALTPGHFLIGRPLTNLPEINMIEIPTNRLTKWQHLQVMVQHYWRRWQKEYLAELQTRTKWKHNSKMNLKVGTLVLIKNDSAPPLSWQLGRVIALHPGKDGITRVVDLKVSDGVLTRAVNRVCALPVE